MADASKKNRALGRGLSALMAEVDADERNTRPSSNDRLISTELLHPNPDQPRKDFSDIALQELADSIRTKGILQPIIVRPSRTNADGYEIVAGERRWRAAQRAQQHQVPVIVRDLDDTEVLEIAIIENIQRADLNPIEEARGYRQLIERFGHTQEQLAQALGKSRSHIANLTRLLNLPDDVQTWVREGKLSAGHARAIVPSSDPIALARNVIDKGLSVRATESLARDDKSDAGKPTKPDTPQKDADTRAFESELSAHLGMKVSIQHKDVTGAGSMTIHYRNLDQLDRLGEVLGGFPQDETR